MAEKIVYLRCPDCERKRVTRREFSDGDGYACDRCDWSAYIEEEGDQRDLHRLVDSNPHAPIRMRFRGGR